MASARAFGIALATAILLAACASTNDFRERAQMACQAETTPAAEMDACVDRMENTLRAAADAEAQASAQAAEARRAARANAGQRPARGN